MFELIEATRFDRKMGVGRTKPLLLGCEGEQGEVEVVAKFSEGCALGGLVREAMTSMFGLDLGLPIPAPYVVQLTDDFIASIPDVEVARFLRAGDKLGFGSRRLPDGYSAWIPPAARMTESLEQEALEIFAFDCWLTNGDRRTSNPNLLSNGKRFAIFDHELALMTTLNLFWKEPWIASALDGTRPPEDHVFFGHLRGRAAYKLEGARERLAAITDERVTSYANALPASWVVDPAEVSKMRTFIIQLRDNLADATKELTRALA